MLPVLPGVKIGAHVEVFRDRGDGTRELVHTSRPGEVCSGCGAELTGVLAIPKGSGQRQCVNCLRG